MEITWDITHLIYVNVELYHMNVNDEVLWNSLQPGYFGSHPYLAFTRKYVYEYIQALCDLRW